MSDFSENGLALQTKRKEKRRGRLYITGIMKKKGKKKDDGLRRELSVFQKQGILLCLDGKPSTPKEIARACHVAEDCTYMRDYISNERGEVKQIQFNQIKET